MAHEYDGCQAKTEIDNLKHWQESQNGKLGRLADGVQTLCEHEAYRKGGERMLKWIIGLVGVTGAISLLSLLVGVLR